jgi:hypothetical protein
MRVQVSPRLQVGYLIFIIYIYINGKVAEWSNAPVLKTGEPARFREFESHPFRISAPGVHMKASLAQLVEPLICNQ